MCPICRNAVRNGGCTHDAFLTEDSLTGRGRSMIPSVASLLDELYPERGAREWLPMLTIIYMAPGGHRQWPMSITALLERLSWPVLQTRSLALFKFQADVQKNPKRKPRCRCGPKVAVAPPGTDNIFHPRFIGDAIPSANTFHAVIHERADKWIQDNEEWCLEEAWFAHSPTF